MSALKNHEYDCTVKCRAHQHGNAITAALTKRSIEDDKLAAFVAKTCANFANIRDDLGRSAVHMCASVGRYNILEWLLNHGALIDQHDLESGSSPLHRSLFYGCIDCAVLLLRHGANPELLDEDTRCPMQAICRMWDILAVAGNKCELLVWGSNKNYNLGIGDEQLSATPQFVNFFRKSNICIDQMALGAYHSLFRDEKGNLYAVGHGKGGRLGSGNENSLTAPKRVKLPLKGISQQNQISISVSRQHSLVLMFPSLVYACGMNDSFQLGVREAGDSLTTFKEVVALRDKGVSGLIGVLACDQHSIAYSTSCVYVWGANLGQFGISANNKTLKTPTLMRLPEGTNVHTVVGNNAATVVYSMDSKMLFLFYADKMRSIRAPNYESLKTIEVSGGNIKNSVKGTAAALKLLMLTETNVVFLWYENTQQFYKCTFSPIRLPEINQILYRRNQVLVLSDGCVYQGKCVQLPMPEQEQQQDKHNLDKWQNNDPNRTEFSREYYIRIELQRLPSIDRAVDIACDESFSSFAVIQDSNKKYLQKPTKPRPELHFKKLYHDTSDTDAVHDVVFHVDGEQFAAHKFIVFSQAPGLRDIILMHLDKHVQLKQEQLTGKMFELVLKYIYCNYWPNEEDIDCMEQSLGPNKPEQRCQVCEIFHRHLEEFQLHKLAAHMTSFYLEQTSPLTHRQRPNRLKRSDYPDLHDVRIICEHGEVLEAHKCILVARLEYFDMMFMHSWAERATVNFESMPAEYMEPILDYLYSLDADAFGLRGYSETFLYNMIVLCDQYFIESLQQVCELLILDKISIRKCGEMLDFAVMYNCKLLLRGCMDFICHNLARVLNYRSLEQCEPAALHLLNDHYRTMFKKVFDYRQITPFSEAVEDELLLSFVDGCDVDLDYRMDVQTRKSMSERMEATKRKQQSKQHAHAYEQQAISSMMRTLSVSEDVPTAVAATPTATPTAHEEKNWSRVVDKKEQKRKLAETALKVNNQLKEEPEPEVELTILSPKTPAKEREQSPPTSTPNAAECTPPSKSYNLDLSSLRSQSQKLSQKQRKRLSSESQSWRAAPSTLEPSTPPSQPVPNAWGVTPQSPTAVYVEPAVGSSSDPTSFANMMRAGQQSLKSPEQQSGNSFSQILADERRQRENYERMRNKSLVHTQIEETAIAELREFYNADNVDDETITVERRSRPSNINFSSWTRH